MFTAPLEPLVMWNRFFIVIFIMLSSACRAFVPNTHLSGRKLLVRFMSSTTSSNDSIVEICRRKISEELGTDAVTVKGAFDDPNGSHISIEVISDKFEGKRAVQRQQMVYKALWEELKGPVHAVDSMVCKTPSEST
jgi:stress-induced morphogen